MIVRAKHWIKVGEDDWVESGETFEIDPETLPVLSGMVEIVDDGDAVKGDPALPVEQETVPVDEPTAPKKRGRKKKE